MVHPHPERENHRRRCTTLGQLNTTKGDGFDGQTLYRQRSTRILPACGALIALAIGYLLIRGRRLEIASALHCGVPKPALATQIIIETGITICSPPPSACPST